MTPRDVGKALADVTGEDAQLLLSLLVWPKDAPLPSVVDEWVRGHPPASPPVRRGRRVAREAFVQFISRRPVRAF